MKIIPLFLCITISTQLFSDGVTSSPRTSNQVKIYHTGDQVEYSVGDDFKTIIDEGLIPTIELNRDHQAEVIIADNNPVIFKYTSKSEMVDVEDLQALKKFADAVLKAFSLDEPIPKQFTAEMHTSNKTRIDDLIRYIGRIEPIIEKTVSGRQGVESAKAEVRVWELDEKEVTLSQYLTDQNIDALEGYNKVVSFLKEFKKNVLSINDGEKVHQIKNSEALKKEKIKISVNLSEKYQEFWSPKVVNFAVDRKMDIHLNAVRKRPFYVTPGLGVVYSFVKDPDYSVDEDDSGNRTVAQKSDEYKEFQGAVVLNFIPDAFYKQGVEPYIQIGISPEDSQIGFMAGLGFRIMNLSEDKGSFDFSLGAIYQEATKLDGLSVGDSLTKDSDLKTKEEFELGFYVMAGYKF